MAEARGLESARERRRQLGNTMHALEESVARPVSIVDWQKGVHHAVTDLDRAFRAHCEEVERPDGLLDEIMHEAPRLENVVALIRKEHTEMERRLADLTDRLESSEMAAAEHRVALRESTDDLLTLLVRHRRRGADLVYEAYLVDIGGWSS